MSARSPRARRAAVVVPVVLLALTACSGSPGDPTDPSPEGAGDTTPTAQTTAAEDVEREECPPAAERDDRRAAIGVARCAVIAFTEFSYRDDDHRAWIDRVAPYATDTFVADLRELFGDRVPAEVTQWKDLVEARTEARTVVTSAEAARDGATFVVTVVAGTERRTEEADWAEHGGPRTYEVTLEKVGGDWRVAGIA